MPNITKDKTAVLDAIRQVASETGRTPSMKEFQAKSGLRQYHVLTHFPSWREAVRQAGLEPDRTNIRLEDGALLTDWGELVRRYRQIPTRALYRREGRFSPGVFERHFGPWSGITTRFKEFAISKPKWADVLNAFAS